MSETWFTSDTHFGHKNIPVFCPQRMDYLGMPEGDIDYMNLALVELWNNTVAPEDEVIFLGDFAMGKIHDTIQYASMLNGTIHMYWGNHDRPHPCNFKNSESDTWPEGSYQKHLKWVEEYGSAGFHTQRLNGFHDFGGGVVASLNHFPYTGDSEPGDRYTGFRLEDDGLPLVHGHVHDMWKVKDHQINVGIDAWGRILHESEVRDLVAKVNVN